MICDKCKKEYDEVKTEFEKHSAYMDNLANSVVELDDYYFKAALNTILRRKYPGAKNVSFRSYAGDYFLKQDIKVEVTY